MKFKLLDDIYNRAYLAYNMRADSTLKQNDIRIDLAARSLLKDKKCCSEADVREKKVQVLKAYFSSLDAGVNREEASELAWLVNATNLFGEVQHTQPNFDKALQKNLAKVKAKFPNLPAWNQFSSALVVTQNFYVSKHLPKTICNAVSAPLIAKKGAPLHSNQRMEDLAIKIDRLMDRKFPMSKFAELIAVDLNLEIKSIIYANKKSFGADEIIPAKESLLLLMKNGKFVGAISMLWKHLQSLDDPQYDSIKKEVNEYKMLAEKL